MNGPGRDAGAYLYVRITFEVIFIPAGFRLEFLPGTL